MGQTQEVTLPKSHIETTGTLLSTSNDLLNPLKIHKPLHTTPFRAFYIEAENTHAPDKCHPTPRAPTPEPLKLFKPKKSACLFRFCAFLVSDEQNACLDAANRLKHQGLMTTRPSHARSNCSRFFKRQKQKRQMVNLAFF